MVQKTLKEASLVFVRRGQEVFLARKTKHIGAGLLNGFGGGIDEGETPAQGAARELFEEAGLEASPEDLEQVALAIFHNELEGGGESESRVHVFIVDMENCIGDIELNPTEMVDGRFRDVKNLPLNEMMPADKIWVPLVLDGKKLRIEARYSPYQKELIGKVRLRPVTTFSDEFRGELK